MKKVKFLTDTAFQGPRKEGDVISVADDFANRWAKNGIAEIIGSDDSNDRNIDDNNYNEPEGTDEVTDGNLDMVDYASMSAKDLFAACKEKGIEVEAKKSKEYYIEKLNAN